MDEYISKTDIENAVTAALNGWLTPTARVAVEDLWITIDRMRTLSAPMDVQTAYLHGKIAGIEQCRVQLEEVMKPLEGGTPT